MHCYDDIAAIITIIAAVAIITIIANAVIVVIVAPLRRPFTFLGTFAIIAISLN